MSLKYTSEALVAVKEELITQYGVNPETGEFTDVGIAFLKAKCRHSAQQILEALESASEEVDGFEISEAFAFVQEDIEAEQPQLFKEITDIIALIKKKHMEVAH